MRYAKTCCTLLAITLVLAAVSAAGAAAPAPAAPAAKDTTLFLLGKPDGVSAEFGGVADLWPSYAKAFGVPVDFTVGKSALKAWPYIHPSTKDTWAGGKAHTYTLRYKSAKADDRPLYFILGLADVQTAQPQVTVTVNGQALPPQRAPEGAGTGARNPHVRHQPSSLIFALPAGAIVAGDNTLTIHCETGSWMTYDYVLLTADPKPPALVAATVVKKPVPPPAVLERDETLLAQALAGPLAGAEEIVFAVRAVGGDGHWYANFSYYAEDDQRLTYRDGGRLCRLNLRTGKLTTLLDDPNGGVRDPAVHYDGRKAVFSYRKGGTCNYHLYEMNLDGTGLRQLTDGPYDDFEAAYLPDGDLMFVSSRCKRWVNCWLTKVAVLYRCDASGNNIRMISSNNEQDNTPAVLPDGTVLYTRWEYVDRSQVHYHHLWLVNPDGTGQMVYYGNQRPGVVMIDSKPIPGTNKVVSVFSPGHGKREHAGPIAVVDPNVGPDDPAGARMISRASEDFRDPYPLSEDLFLVARLGELMLMNGRGAVQTVYTLPEAERKEGFWVHEPSPIRARLREPVIAPRIDLSNPNGRMVLVDANLGRNMEGVKPGEIKKLLILETLPKPINFTGGMEPLSMGGTFTLERVLGTVPVEADGSAHFEVPALRSVFFVALDANDVAVKRMQSFVTLQPGETAGCVGCHEKRTDRAPQTAYMTALARPPSRIRAIDDVPQVLDFPRDVQPILDKNCAGCHGYEKTADGGPYDGGVILTGDRGPIFSHSYFMLSAHEMLADGRNRAKSNYPPRALGSGASRLLAHAEGGHHGVKVSGLEREILRLWIDTGAAYPGTYAALGTGMVGGYAQNKLDRSDTEWPAVKAAIEVEKRRCASCHVGALTLPESPSDDLGMPPWAIKYGSPPLRFSRHILYNLSRPEKSLLVLAPLAKEAGGWGLCAAGVAEKKPGTVVFADAKDPDYQALVASIRAAGDRLNTIKRFDMAGFQPRAAYLREMRHYGLLPAGHPDDKPVNPYALDEAYWRSFWYVPPLPVAALE